MLLAVLGLAPTGAAAGTLLILPFENRSQRAALDWIGESVAESLSEQLRAPDRYRHMVTRAERAAAFDQLGIPSTGILSHATIFKIAELTDADQVVLGSFELVEDRLSLSAQVLEMRRPRLSGAVKESGPLAELLEIQNRLAVSVLRAAGLSGPVGIARQGMRLDAWENYIRGLMATEGSRQVKFFREAARLQPAFPAPAFHLGKIYFQSRDYQTAVPWLLKLKKEDVNYLEAGFLLGLAYAHLEEWDKAEAAFRAVIEGLPLNEAYNNLGVAQSRRGKRAAAESFLKALEGDPGDPDYSFNLGYFHWRAGEYAQAARRFREALAGRPGDLQARLLLDKSLEHLAVLSETGPRLLQPIDESKLEDLDRLKHNYEEDSFRQLLLALQTATEEKLRTLPDAEHALAHLERAGDLFREERDAEALAELEETLRLQPENGEALLYLARLHARAGRAGEAAACALRAAELGKKGAEPYLVLATIYLEQGKPEEALDAVGQALRREPQNPAAQSLLRRMQSGPRP